MLKSKKKVVKKQKPKPKITQKQEQKQMTKVVVNIGKSTKSKSTAPRKEPAPVRPQVIPVYTPIYQSQPQQQYNNDDLRTLFRARTQANENPLKELTREIKLPLPNRPPIRLEEQKEGYTDPKLDYEVLLDYKDPLDTRPPDSIMANAHFREVANEEYQVFDKLFLKPEQAPTLTETIGETTREELSTEAEEPPAGGGGGGGGGPAEEPEQPAPDDLDELTYKELKRVVDRYNDENKTDRIPITKPNLVGKGTTPKSKLELLADYKAKLRAIQLK